MVFEGELEGFEIDPGGGGQTGMIWVFNPRYSKQYLENKVTMIIL